MQKEAAALRAAGYQVATEVTLFVYTPTGNRTARADIIARVPGSNIYAIHEIKTGNAQLTGNQEVVYNAGLAIVKGNNGLPVGLKAEDFLPISEYGVVRCLGL